MEQDSTAGEGDELERYEPAGGVIVHTRAVREFAASTWLLTAAQDRDEAREEWERQGVAMLRCGGAFTVVQVPLVLVEAVAGTSDQEQIGSFLDEALHGGAVFIDTTMNHVYFLVPGSTWRRWRTPDAACMGPDTFIGVPYPGADSGHRRYWLLEMDGPGALCRPDAVAQLVMHARYRAAGGHRRA